MAITKRMGFEGEIYYGAAGSTAATKITNTRDITISLDLETGDTTIRGDGSAPPISTFRVTGRNFSVTFQMLMKSDDTTYTALVAASVAGTPVAIRLKPYSAGSGYDGDMIVQSMGHGKPLKGEQTVDFTCVPNDDNRAPQLNA